MNIDKLIEESLERAKRRYEAQSCRTELDQAQLIRVVLEIVAVLGIDNLPRPEPIAAPSPPTPTPPTPSPAKENRVCVHCGANDEGTRLWRPRPGEQSVWLHNACIRPFGDAWSAIWQRAAQAKAAERLRMREERRAAEMQRREQERTAHV